MTALIILALAVLAAIAAVQVHQGHASTVFGNVHTVARWLGERQWDGVWIVVIGAVLAALGLLLLLSAVLPARHRLLAVRESHPGVTSGITRRGLRADLAAVAEGVDGVSSAKARVRRRRVRVRAQSQLRDRAGIQDGIVAAVDAELTLLGLTRARTVRARVSGPDPDPSPVPATESAQDSAESEPDADVPATPDAGTDTDIGTDAGTDSDGARR